MLTFVLNVGYATVFRFMIEWMRVGAASIEKKTKEERRESISERYGIRVAYRTLHQCNALSDTRQRHYGAIKYAIRACAKRIGNKEIPCTPKLTFRSLQNG